MKIIIMKKTVFIIFITPRNRMPHKATWRSTYEQPWSETERGTAGEGLHCGFPGGSEQGKV